MDGFEGFELQRFTVNGVQIAARVGGREGARRRCCCCTAFRKAM